MWLDGSQNFTLMGFSGPLAFHRDIQRVRSASRSTRFQFALALRCTICQKHARSKGTAKELSSLHDTCPPGIAILAAWVDRQFFCAILAAASDDPRWQRLRSTTYSSAMAGGASCI
jgi:hypothetical protein